MGARHERAVVFAVIVFWRLFVEVRFAATMELFSCLCEGKRSFQVGDELVLCAAFEWSQSRRVGDFHKVKNTCVGKLSEVKRQAQVHVKFLISVHCFLGAFRGSSIRSIDGAFLLSL